MAKTFRLTAEQYSTIESKIALKDNEDYAVVAVQRHGKIRFGIHVFERQPSSQEMMKYEELASKVKFKGSKAELEGSAIAAAKFLYDRLIARAYDLQIGRHVHDQLASDKCSALVPPLMKREAIREFLGNVSGMTALEEDEGSAEVVGASAEAEED